MNLKNTLKEVFGYEEFRPNQEAIIQNLLNKKDCLALMPTGGGKSLCYQLPAIMSDGLAVVISPLIALMKDQVDALRLNGVNAAYFNSTLDELEKDRVFMNIRQDKLKLLYIAPEGLFSNKPLFDLLQSKSLSLFAIDEAHCISQWGHDFRPEYRRLSALKRLFPNSPVIALTATADIRTRNDIVANLNLDKPEVFVSSFNRANITYSVRPKSDSRSKLHRFLAERKGQSGIVYTLSRKSTEEIAGDLQLMGLKALPYHAGLERSVRNDNQEKFIKDEIDIIVATIAFGMGIDKSNVRFVVHMHLPKNVEAYYQETGRAGRDGLQSEALLFFSRGDAITLRGFAEVEDDPKQTMININKLNQMIAFGESRQCRRKFLLNYFGEDHSGNCQSCDNCLTEFKTFDGTEIAQKALSAVYRLKQGFGVSYVIDFLRGSQAQRIKLYHRNIKTYGAGADISKKDWQKYMRNLIDFGYLKVSDGNYPVLLLTAKSNEVLFRGAKVELVQTETVQGAKTIEVLDTDPVLLDLLKKIRRQFAEKEGVAPYMVFSDKTLSELAAYIPTERNDLLRINGFGEVKLIKYGDVFLNAIIQYCHQNNLTSKIDQKIGTPKRKSALVKEHLRQSATKDITYNMFKQGKSIDEIANERGVSKRTIEDHLITFIRRGELDVRAIVEADKISIIENAWKELGDVRLRAIRDKLGDEYDWSDLRAVKARLEFESES
ncbi:MAG: DNA helicase RecQ [Bacteroidota bacterium]